MLCKKKKHFKNVPQTGTKIMIKVVDLIFLVLKEKSKGKVNNKIILKQIKNK